MSAMHQLRPTPPRTVQYSPSHVDPGLHTQSHVFIRQDSVRKPLQQPYKGPYKVLSRTQKHFTVEVNGRQEIVSVDRLKPAYLCIVQPSTADSIPIIPSNPPANTTPPPTPKVTRFGRNVKLPNRLTF